MELGHAGAEVVEEDGLRRVELRPVWALGERVAVQVIRHIDPAARVAVLQPRPTDVAILLVNVHVHAGLSKSLGRGDARHTRADHRHLDRTARCQLFRSPPRGPVINPTQGELLGVEREVVVVERPGHELDQAAQLCGVGWRSGLAAVVPERDQRSSNQIAPVRQLFRRETVIPHHHDFRRVWAQLFSQQGVVTRQMRDSCHQWPHRNTFEAYTQRLVIVGNGFGLEVQPHGVQFLLWTDGPRARRGCRRVRPAGRRRASGCPSSQ
jgi:hypothetical protein